jgi:hypothetical protein
MPHRTSLCPRYLSSVPRASPTWTLALARALALVALLLLPVQMRAGGADAHPHALLHLMLDARDGTFDHHDADHQGPHQEHSATHEVESASAPDAPSFADTNLAGGGIAILAAVVALFAVPRPDTPHDWARPTRWRDWLTALELPPPRAVLA